MMTTTMRFLRFGAPLTVVNSGHLWPQQRAKTFATWLAQSIPRAFDLAVYALPFVTATAIKLDASTTTRLWSGVRSLIVR